MPISTVAQRERGIVTNWCVRVSWKCVVRCTCKSESTSYVCLGAESLARSSSSLWIVAGVMSFSCCISCSVAMETLTGRINFGELYFSCVVPCSSGTNWMSVEVTWQVVALCSSPVASMNKLRGILLSTPGQCRVIWRLDGKWNTHFDPWRCRNGVSRLRRSCRHRWWVSVFWK
jgi:hypothetical protein